MTTDAVITDLLAEREYEAQAAAGGATRKVVLRIGRPRPDPEGDWLCPVQVVGLEDDAVMNVNGIDAVQALLLAMQMAGARLTHPPRGVTVTWMGMPDVGLPLPGPAAAAWIDDEAAEGTGD